MEASKQNPSVDGVMCIAEVLDMVCSRGCQKGGGNAGGWQDLWAWLTLLQGLAQVLSGAWAAQGQALRDLLPAGGGPLVRGRGEKTGRGKE